MRESGMPGPALPLLLSTAIAASPSALVVVHHRQDYSGRMSVTAEGGRPCEIELTGDGQDHEYPLDLPPAARHIRIDRSVEWTHYARGRRGASGSLTLPIADLGPMMAGLRAEGPMRERLARFQEAKAAFERKDAALAEAGVALEPGDLPGSDAIAAAEKRLGFALPPEHAELLGHLGAATLDDSYFMRPEHLSVAFEQMVDDWGTPRPSLEKSLSAETARLLRASTILYTEVGDGLGGWLYAPASAACEGRAAFYWLHQDSIDRPRVLKTRGGACLTYAQALVWLLHQQASVRYESGTDSIAIVDRGAAPPVRLGLQLDPGGRPTLAVTLRPIWEQLE